MQKLERTQSERSLYERLVVYEDDFRQAHYFAGYLLKNGWHRDPFEKRVRWPTYMKQAAFTSALVSAYCRPFTQTRGGATLSLKLVAYDSKELKLHKRIEGLRNSVYAHSDVRAREVRPISFDGQATAIVSAPSLRLTKEETELLIGMIGRTATAVRDRIQSLLHIAAGET